jgi:hypothetical protein
MHQHRRRGVLAFTVASALLIPAYRDNQPADNTKGNKRNRAEGATTADQQNEIS